MKTDYLTVYKYPIILLVLALLSGCQHKLVPRLTSTETHPPKATTNEPATVAAAPAPGKSIVIDPAYSIDAGVAAIYMRDKQYLNEILDKVKSFYTLNGFQTKWVGDANKTELYDAFVDILKGSSQYGLNPDDYSADDIDRRVALVYSNSQNPASELYNLDVQITGMFFLYTAHVMKGRVKNVSGGNKIWIREFNLSDDVALLLSLNEPAQLTAGVNKLHPEHQQYLRLQAALNAYKKIDAANGESSPIYISDKIKPNDKSAAIPAIRKKLSLTDMKADSVMMDSVRYDENLVSAVKWFQVRHGLEPDGVIGAGTLKFLNQSFSHKIQIMELNLERMRWLPKTYGDNYIVINIPEYKMRVFENKAQQIEMKVIVGAEATATPVFSDTLWYIVFSPTWAVPNSIIRDEIIPKLQRDSTYYSGRNYTFYKNGAIFDPATESWKGKAVNSYAYNVVQQPGADNALGLVKFIMPNKMSIYLHDTPNHRLFSKSYRALSHGCVRLDDPGRLAAFLLKDQRGWDAAATAKAMYANRTQTVYLKKPYRVQIEYFTAWVDDQGLVNFRDDIYGHDKRQMSQLNTAATTETIASN